MTEQAPAAKIDIPLEDIRHSSLTELFRRHKDKTLRLLNESRKTFGFLSRLKSCLILPLADFLARRWLKKTANPYREEIESFAREARGGTGLVGLNLSYEWGCTTCAASHDGGTRLLRVMDWDFPKLGENIVVAHQQGKAGDFYNVTWPGLSGVFNAVAPARFAAAINLAPARRHKGGLLLDRLRNFLRVGRQKSLPPAHLLRQAFETAASYDEAKKMLAETPVAAPVIFTLTGTKKDEGCVIERTEDRAVIRELREGRVCAANHFETSLNGEGLGWMPRGDNNSHLRMEAAGSLPAAELDEDFTWFKAPIACDRSRLALAADAGKGTLSLIGTDGTQAVTNVFRLPTPSSPAA